MSITPPSRRGAGRALSAVAVLALALPGVALLATPAPATAAPATDRTVQGPGGTAFGSTASQARCDVNGDGVPDLAVGTYATFDTSPGATGAYVLLGAGTRDTGGTTRIEDERPVRIIDTARNMMGGVDVRCAGDVNGDGLDDLVVVAQAVGSFIVFGSADFSEVRLDSLGDRGRTVLGSITRGNGVGDIDGDGRDEVAVTDTSGVVTILHAEQLPSQSLLSDAPGPRISGTGIDLVSVSRAGDMNGDGREDLAVGASSWKAPGAERFATGVVWVITDSSADVRVGADPIPGFRIDGPPRGYDLLGTATVGLGDIDGDGYDDLLIGGESDEPKPGSAVVVTGGPDGVDVRTDPLATDGPAVREAAPRNGAATAASAAADASSAAAPRARGWWINGMASGDHFGHGVGAVRMRGWSMLLVGGMDGSPDPAREGSGYAVAVDSRFLAAGKATGASRVLETSELTSTSVPGVELIAGERAGQRLGRAFADLAGDPAGKRVTFAVGAPAIFSDSEDPAVRILSLDTAAPVKPDPEPTPKPTPTPTVTPKPTVQPTPTAKPATGFPGDAGAGSDGRGAAGAAGAKRSLAETGAEPRLGLVWAAAVAAGLGAVGLAAAGLVAVRRRRAAHGEG